MWAHDLAGEAAATKQLVDHLEARRQRFPNMHVYHYNHTERSSLERLTMEHGVAELELERLVETGMFVDLYPIVTASLQVGTETYGLKQIERLTGYERGHEIDRGAGAVVEYERWMADRDDGPSHAHRRLQRGRRPGDPGGARLARRTAAGGHAVASGGDRRLRSPTRSSTPGSRRSTRSAPAPPST